MSVINRTKQLGFTIIEMLFAVGLMALIVQSSLYYFENSFEKASAARTIGAVDEITMALYSYRIDPDNTIGGVAQWPDVADVNAPGGDGVPDDLVAYLPIPDPRTGNGQSFALRPLTTRTGPMYEIVIPTSGEFEANIIFRNYPASATLNEEDGVFIVTRTVQRPGGETGNGQFVLIDGTRDVEGNLSFNGGAVFNDATGLMAAQITQGGTFEAARFEQLANTNSLLFGLELQRSGNGLADADIFGRENTLVLGSSAAGNEIQITTNNVQIPKLENGEGSFIRYATGVIGQLTVEKIVIE